MRIGDAGPDIAVQLGVARFGRIAGIGCRRIDIDDFRRDRSEACIKMVGRFDQQDILGGRIDAEIGKDVG
jgi:hypothetical protein